MFHTITATCLCIGATLVLQRRRAAAQPSSRRPRVHAHEALSRAASTTQRTYSVGDDDVTNVQQLLREAAAGIRPIDETPLVYITTRAQLEQLRIDLAAAQVVAVDLEHSKSSFHGFVCTIQLSTPACDYIIDCLAPGCDEESIRSALQDCFISRRCLKLLHGCSNDVRWLDSNFGLYLNHVVDTSILAVAVGLREHALDRLLLSLLSVAVDKSYQRADWRCRPLPQPFIHYARSDTHYLAAVAHALLQRDAGQLKAALSRSAALTLLRYDSAAREAFDAQRMMSAIQRCSRGGVVPPSHRLCVAATSAAYARHVLALGADAEPDGIASCDVMLAYCAQALNETASLPELDSDLADSVARSSTLLHALSRIVRIVQDMSELDAAAHMLPSVRVPHAVTDLIAITPADAVTPISSVSAAPLPASTTAGSSREALKSSRALALFVPRASPLYNNIELLSPDGVCIARIDKKKAAWYIDVGAVDVLDGAGVAALDGTPEDGSSPLRLRLKQAPRGLGHAGDSFHLAPKLNKCVVCGVTWEAAQAHGGLNRCYVLPHAYRQHLPLSAKSYSSHEVVLTCGVCHRKVDMASAHLVKRLSVEMDIPTYHAAGDGRVTTAVPGSDDARVSNMQRCVRALVNAKLPPHVRADMTAQVLAHEDIAVRLFDAIALPAAERDEHALSAVWTSARLQFVARAQARDLIAALGGDTIALEPAQPIYDFARIVMRSVLTGDAHWARGEACFPAAGSAMCPCQRLDEAALRAAAAESVGSRCECGRNWDDGIRAAARRSDPAARLEPRDSVSGLPREVEERITRFVLRWRHNFMARVQPRAMPASWRVDYRVFQAGLRRGQEEPALVLEVMARYGLSGIMDADDRNDMASSDHDDGAAGVGSN